MEPQITQRGQFFVLSNYVPASSQFKCHESITVTTQGDFTFIENLLPLVERWQGPVSVALYAPGTDFDRTVASIRYLRECTNHIIEKFVTFHIFFETEHTPETVSWPEGAFDCAQNPPFRESSAQTYKAENDLVYPINVGRNVAREMATTHFVLALDIELFPNPGFIPKFLDMIARDEPPLDRPYPRVFPLPVFEIKSGEKIPENKSQLREMLDKNLAIYFHKDICYSCHKIPKFDQWKRLNESQNFGVFRVVKRIHEHKHWEPFYVGTNAEPLYDERLSWEGRRNKMTNGFILCVLDYDLMVLDNAFLVHRPGIKEKSAKNERRSKLVKETNKLIEQRILPEMKVLYGFKDGCIV
ncbi:N-acetyllactosaminide beta-1,3-N-acetylglucosaminyltransferase-like Protein [Tribolium castaneum]|uniref:N-acetyllactosaminide beta-1,3-N-acetylglucosaminyltransferase-like Protein n=2 Tax=Tribolium castaneum TaxID=7070 RepID=D2A3Y5_TRICA|nr:N-acetyllactosaminide beta-1,3-N-acetylglucosaminyltransferase-like Protein [Tribolium castaneum]